MFFSKKEIRMMKLIIPLGFFLLAFITFSIARYIEHLAKKKKNFIPRWPCEIPKEKNTFVDGVKDGMT